MNNIYLISLCALPVIVIGTDQYIKYRIMKKWSEREYQKTRTSKVFLRPVINTGGFLGFGKRRSKLFFIAIFFVAFALMTWMILMEVLVLGIDSVQVYLLLALLSAGVSNTIDRIRHGGVIDYLQIAIGKKFIIVNFADMVIFASGIVYLVLSVLAP